MTEIRLFLAPHAYLYNFKKVNSKKVKIKFEKKLGNFAYFCYCHSNKKITKPKFKVKPQFDRNTIDLIPIIDIFF